MGNETITVSLNPSGIQKLIDALKAKKKWLEEKTEELVKELAEIGVQTASVKFADAIYDGTNDVTVEKEQDGSLSAIVRASGDTVLFIEFGTGITYPDNHPEASALGMTRGSYGHHLGLLESWKSTCCEIFTWNFISCKFTTCIFIKICF